MGHDQVYLFVVKKKKSIFNPNYIRGKYDEKYNFSVCIYKRKIAERKITLQSCNSYPI